MIFNINNLAIDVLQSALLRSKDLSVSVARLDQLHPIVSGNKLFKLHYFLEQMDEGKFGGVQTFGGAYSNHLVATAFACQQRNIPSKGFVRGEKPGTLSHTLQHCLNYGMQLEFLSRENYTSLATSPILKTGWLTIPEGGYNACGAKGAALIMNAIREKYSHICLAVGTATTLAGILRQAKVNQTVIAVQVLKGMNDISDRLQELNEQKTYINLKILQQYHWGGYARYNPSLLQFMNALYRQHQLPTDFVYTAKLMYAIFDQIEDDQFPPGSNILCLHTGGLQGNGSLPLGSLIF